MSAWARPGQKVVCIRADNFGVATRLGFAIPDLHGVYTIREVVVANRYSNGVPDIGCTLVEIRNPLARWRDGSFDEVGWLLANFRPLITQADDIARFTHHFLREGADA